MVSLFYSPDNISWKTVGSSPPVVESFNIDRGAGNTCTLNRPSGVREGDLLIVICTKDGTGSALSGPAGFSVLVAESESGEQTTASWWKEANDSESSSYAVTWGGVSEDYVGGIIRISGANTVDPVDVSDTNTGTGNVIAPDVTTTENNSLILRFCGIDDDDQGDSFGVPAGTVELWARASPSGTGECSGSCAYENQTTNGSTGTATWLVGKSGVMQPIPIPLAHGHGILIFQIVLVITSFIA